MKTLPRRWRALLLASLLTACIPTMEERRPLTIEKGAEDLKCKPSELSSMLIGHRLFRVSGCNREAVYRVICQLGVSSCYLLGGPEWANARWKRPTEQLAGCCRTPQRISREEAGIN
jgi:hypothetical protein